VAVLCSGSPVARASADDAAGRPIGAAAPGLVAPGCAAVTSLATPPPSGSAASLATRSSPGLARRPSDFGPTPTPRSEPSSGRTGVAAEAGVASSASSGPPLGSARPVSGSSAPSGRSPRGPGRPPSSPPRRSAEARVDDAPPATIVTGSPRLEPPASSSSEPPARCSPARVPFNVAPAAPPEPGNLGTGGSASPALGPSGPPGFARPAAASSASAWRSSGATRSDAATAAPPALRGPASDDPPSPVGAGEEGRPPDIGGSTWNVSSIPKPSMRSSGTAEVANVRSADRSSMPCGGEAIRGKPVEVAAAGLTSSGAGVRGSRSPTSAPRSSPAAGPEASTTPVVWPGGTAPSWAVLAGLAAWSGAVAGSRSSVGSEPVAPATGFPKSPPSRN